ncbi:MAG TPA: class A beta-lactamase [Propionibacteriaceae bacterium]
MDSTLTRRTLLVGTAAAAVTAALPAATSWADGRGFTDLEARYRLRIGVYARDLETGQVIAHRPNAVFPMLSTFKVLAVAAVLRGDLVTPDPHVLDRRVFIPPASVVENSPFVADQVARGEAPTVRQLCVAALQRSDNTAGNLLTAMIGGPAAVTRQARRLGDDVTRLDRWEPELNSAEPDRVTDTTTPRAIGTDYAKLLRGDGLRPQQRRQLRTWMLGNTTSTARLGAALPPGWTLADKTGGGAYATNHDVGIAYRPDGSAVLVSVLTRSDDASATSDNAVIREIGTRIFAALPGRR